MAEKLASAEFGDVYYKAIYAVEAWRLHYQQFTMRNFYFKEMSQGQATIA